MDELTALLDGMTDGFFSKRLDEIYEQKPELNRLWAYVKKDEARDLGLVPRDSKLNQPQAT